MMAGLRSRSHFSKGERNRKNAARHLPRREQEGKGKVEKRRKRGKSILCLLSGLESQCDPREGESEGQGACGVSREVALGSWSLYSVLPLEK